MRRTGIVLCRYPRDGHFPVPARMLGVRAGVIGSLGECVEVLSCGLGFLSRTLHLSARVFHLSVRVLDFRGGFAQFNFRSGDLRKSSGAVLVELSGRSVWQYLEIPEQVIDQARDNIAFVVVPGIEFDLGHSSIIERLILCAGRSVLAFLLPFGGSVLLAAGERPDPLAEMVHEERLTGTPLAEYADPQRRVSPGSRHPGRKCVDGAINPQ